MIDDTLYFYQKPNSQEIDGFVVRIKQAYDLDVLTIVEADNPKSMNYLVHANSLTPLTENQIEHYTILKLADKDTSACFQT